MKFSIEAGTHEKHRVDFKFNQLLGKSVVLVDGQEVLRKSKWFSEPLEDCYDLQVGQSEPVHVRIEKERTDMFASKYCVYVDNRLTQYHRGV